MAAISAKTRALMCMFQVPLLRMPGRVSSTKTNRVFFSSLPGTGEDGAVKEMGEKAEEGKEKVQEVWESAKGTAQKLKDSVSAKTEEMKETLQQKTEDAKTKMSNSD